MTKTISLEASKKLEEYMPEETEYMYTNAAYLKSRDGYNEYSAVMVKLYGKQFKKYTYYKTLTLEEAIDLIPIYITNFRGCDRAYFSIHSEIRNEEEGKIWKIKILNWGTTDDELDLLTGKTLLQGVEKMLLYLHDNNLLGKK